MALEKPIEQVDQKKLQEALWDHCFKLYEEGKSYKEEFTSYENYYLGRAKIIKNDPDEEQGDNNANNLCKQIVDTKVTLALDNQVTTTVVPKLGAFQDLSTIKEVRAQADIYNDCLQHIWKINKIDQFKHFTMRNGSIMGMCPSEVGWDADMNDIGDIFVKGIEPVDIRIDKTATNIEKSTFFSMDMEFSPFELKAIYAKNEDGTYNKYMIDKIDNLAEIAEEEKGKDKADKQTKKPTISYTSDQGGGLAHVNTKEGIRGAGKSIKLIKMFLKDDSTFAPEKTDSNKEKEEKVILKYRYPNGRVIVMSKDKKNKVIFDDKPIEYRFGFPVDIFDYSGLGCKKWKGEVEDLVGVQNRLIRAYARLRTLISKFVSIIVLDKAMDVDLQEGDFVNNFVVFIENLKTRGKPDILTNNTIAEIMNLLEYIRQLKSDAKEIARLNDMMISGTREPGTTSGEQIRELREDPQSSIRAKQRLFNEFLVSISNKMLVLIQDFYKFGRIMKLTTGKDIETPKGIMKAEYAKFDEGEISLLDEAGNAIQQIKSMPNIQFQVEIAAGVNIPRSRKENAMLYEKMMTSGILTSTDPDILEEYLRSIDMPNYREIIKQVRAKREQAQPTMPPAEKLNITFKDLPIKAQQQWLEQNGFKVTAEEIAGQRMLEEGINLPPKEMEASAEGIQKGGIEGGNERQVAA